MNLYLIPARAGSKGLPGKNIMNFHGKPLLAWTIQQVKDLKQVAKNAGGYVIVSTDSPDIAKVATEFGASAIYRPAELCTDDAPMSAVIDHALSTCGSRPAEVLVLLQPTSPLRSVDDIRIPLSRLQGAAVSVCECEHPPAWSAQLPPDLCAEVFGRTRDNRRQEDTFYRLNGAVFMARVGYYKEHGFFGPQSFAHIMPRERSADIDTIDDFRYAELIAKYGHQYSRHTGSDDGYGGIY